MKVEIIEEKSRWDLQRRVNEFLKGLSNESIIVSNTAVAEITHLTVQIIIQL